VEWAGDWVTDLKIRHYIWLGRLVRAMLSVAKRGGVVEVRVGARVTDLKIRHYVGMRAVGWGMVGGKRRLWFWRQAGVPKALMYSCWASFRVCTMVWPR